MAEHDLAQVVEGFAAGTVALADADLERPWAWRMYDEGVRHAFFRTYEELRVSIYTRKCTAHIQPHCASDLRQQCATFQSGFRANQVIC